MRELKEAILKRGQVLGKDILKVDSFLNHQIDPVLMEAMGTAFADAFGQDGITKVMTIESGGIVPAYEAARQLGVPVVFVKKAEPSTMLDPLSASVFSYTKQKTYPLCMERAYLSPSDKVLFIDDFMANGQALKGIEDLLNQAGASLAGIGICIEKTFQPGHAYIEKKGYKYIPLASVCGFRDGSVLFAPDR